METANSHILTKDAFAEDSTLCSEPHTPREATDEELDAIAHEQESITISSNEEMKTFHQQGGFSARKLLQCVLELEQISRNKYGDLHHVFFEGMGERNGVYYVYWGS